MSGFDLGIRLMPGPAVPWDAVHIVQYSIPLD